MFQWEANLATSNVYKTAKGVRGVGRKKSPETTVKNNRATRPLTDILQASPSAGDVSSLVGATVSSLSEYLEAVSATLPSSKVLWYRGHSKVSHELVPSLYRNVSTKTEEQLRRMEEQLNRRFRDRAMPHSFQSRDDSSDVSALHSWWRMFSMQHYGTPTRMLDWSENALIALCFAVFGAASDLNSVEDAVVWVLDPEKWNGIGNNNHSGALSVDEHGAKPYAPLPSSDQHVPSVWPLAIFGMHNSPRIVTQQGTFVIFAPGKTASMETHATSSAHFHIGPSALRAIRLSRNSISQMFDALRRLGYGHSTLYPDLHGLATDLKKEFGY